MLSIATDLDLWCRTGRDFAVATVIAVDGSAPRLPGTSLAVDDRGEAVGGVSGGCVEGAVYELCREALATGRTARERFAGGPADDPFAVGFTCGGTAEVQVVPVRAADPARPALAAAARAVATGRATAFARVVEGPGDLLGRALCVADDGTWTGSLGDAASDRAAAAELLARLHGGYSGALTVGATVGTPDGGLCGIPLDLFVESSLTAPRMLIYGAIDFAVALSRVGKLLGYGVTVCDARPVFATPERFPDADEVVVDWPHRHLDSVHTDRRTVVCVLTHDAKFDLPLLERALRLPLAYVGAMGSRRTHLDRMDRLRGAGLDEPELAALHSPIGLDLGARTAEETALSIGAEIVASRYGGSGLPLTGGGIPIHGEARREARTVRHDAYSAVTRKPQASLS